eukprot:TRINITY_DN544_c0_g1_i11.p4 TRINITY_DN544_c0_g1~~TRINITY_DN544_c0_g1_i11.p4  ORF type:complete len:106 (+),score=3.85 TRINITY_DN544_c0_g1_i11:897-1214(+)
MCLLGVRGYGSLVHFVCKFQVGEFSTLFWGQGHGNFSAFCVQILGFGTFLVVLFRMLFDLYYKRICLCFCLCVLFVCFFVWFVCVLFIIIFQNMYRQVLVQLTIF